MPKIEKKGDEKDGQAKEAGGESLSPDALAASGELDKDLSAVVASRATVPKDEGKYDTSERDTE